MSLNNNRFDFGKYLYLFGDEVYIEEYELNSEETEGGEGVGCLG